MSTRNIKPIPSKTAFFTALRRALAHRTYHNEQFGPDDLAEIFLPPHYRFLLRFPKIWQNAKHKLDASMPGMSEYVIARTAYFDRLFIRALQDGASQIAILGAGYDTRAYRFGKINRNTNVFELDAPQTQTRKKECLKAARIQVPQSVKFAPINFLQEPLGDALQRAGYSLNEKTLFLWEGVSYYLDVGSVNETLEFVSHAVQAESAIAFDYSIPLTGENIRHCFGSAEFLKAMQVYHADEALMFSIPEGEIESFLGRRGMRMIEHFDPEAIERAFLLDAQGSRLGRVTGNFRFVLAEAI